MLTEKGLPVTGKKAELVDRLVEAETGVPQIPGVTITRPSDKRAEAEERYVLSLTLVHSSIANSS